MTYVRRFLVALTALAALALAAPALAAAKAKEPPLSVSKHDLRAALHCQPGALHPHASPVLLVTGTGIDGSEIWPTGFQDALAAAGHTSCYIDFPDHTLGDMQVSAEYIVYAVRRMARGASRQIGIYGISQGAVLPRWALTFWPSLREEVTDVVALAGPQHGTYVLLPCGQGYCQPALWQMRYGSNFLRTLNGRDESPGPTAWTTVRTSHDRIVVPIDTALLDGAVNILVQSVCPGRTTSHLEMPADSVSFAVLLDALAHDGPADPARLASGVCQSPYAPGLDPAQVRAAVAELTNLVLLRILGRLVAPVAAEPPIRSYAS